MRDIIGRRRTLTLSLFASAASPLALAAPAAALAPGLPPSSGKTYVLVHGAWLGGWWWAPVAERLRAQGHRVFAPTQTGLGERRHLLSRDVTIDTFVEDIANVIRAEELQDIILVGHSFGGLSTSGVVDRMPERIRRLVYLDANPPQNGKSVLDSLPPRSPRRADAPPRSTAAALAFRRRRPATSVALPPSSNGWRDRWRHSRSAPTNHLCISSIRSAMDGRAPTWPSPARRTRP